MLRPAGCALLASLMMLGGFGRAQASRMTLYIWGDVQQDIGSFQILNQEADVSEGFPGFTQMSGVQGSFGWPPDGWSKAIDGSITIGVALYDGNEQGLAYGYLRGRIEGALTHPGPSSSISGGATGEATLDLDSLSYYTLDRWTGLPIPSTIDRVPSWFYDLKATLEGRMLPGREQRYEVTLTIAPVPEPGSVAVFLAAAGGGLLMLRCRVAS